MLIVLGADHAGVHAKDSLKLFLERAGHTCEDYGAYDTRSVDYPDIAHRVVSAMKESPDSVAVLVCGTGTGMAMAANRHQGVRAFVGHSIHDTHYARAHNDANVITFGSRTMDLDTMQRCLHVFLTTSFEGERHERRVEKIEKAAP